MPQNHCCALIIAVLSTFHTGKADMSQFELRALQAALSAQLANQEAPAVRQLTAELLTRVSTQLLYSVNAETRPLLSVVHLAQQRADGSLVMPPGTRHVLMEIGCSDLDTVDDILLPHDPHAFLISFEPLLDKYALLLGRGTARHHGSKINMAVPLGFHHPRGVVLPLAISPRGPRLQQINVSRFAGCTSLVAVNEENDWARDCLKMLETRYVPTITGAQALGLAGGLFIERLKIDAQGMDFSIVSSFPRDMLARVRQIVMEVRGSHCKPLYQGQESCDQVREQMQAFGFDMQGSRCPAPKEPCERDVFFSNRVSPPEKPAVEADLHNPATARRHSNSHSSGRAGSKGAAIGACTWDNGCCARHPTVASCTSTAVSSRIAR